MPLQPLLMHCGGSDLGGRLDALDAAMREANPDWEPLSEGARAAICASVAAAPDPSAAQRARIAHMLRGAWMRA